METKMKPKEYEATLSVFVDPNCGETYIGCYRFTHPQPAVDAAREFVREFAGTGYPRASVTRRMKVPRLLFNTWRTPAGEVKEKRHTG